jgi:hypothetical protein
MYQIKNPRATTRQQRGGQEMIVTDPTSLG